MVSSNRFNAVTKEEEIKLISKLSASVTRGNRKNEDKFEYNKDAEMYVCKAGHMAIRKAHQGKRDTSATGRTPNSDNMGLEKAGVIVDEKGFIKVNEYLQTSNPNVYAVGDVIGNYMLVTVDAHEGSVAGENATQNNIRKPNYKAVPHAIFTSPQVASVGLKESEAIELGFKVDSRTLDMALDKGSCN